MPGHARALEWQFNVGLWFIAARFYELDEAAGEHRKSNDDNSQSS
jgi:hypothetical protein